MRLSRIMGLKFNIGMHTWVECGIITAVKLVQKSMPESNFGIHRR